MGTCYGFAKCTRPKENVYEGYRSSVRILVEFAEQPNGELFLRDGFNWGYSILYCRVHPVEITGDQELGHLTDESNQYKYVSLFELRIKLLPLFVYHVFIRYLPSRSA